jgi:hypothetical protein
MTITQSDGVTPVANAAWEIVYMQPSLSDQPVGTNIPLNVLASGFTGSNGALSATLNTSSIATADFGDASGGADTGTDFNADLFLQDSAGHQQLVSEILTVSTGNTGAASVSLASSASGSAALAPGALPTSVPVLANTYRYTPVTPLNDGDGMKVQLHYGHTNSLAKQTQVTVGLSTPLGGWQQGGLQLEEKSRGVDAYYYQDHGFHAWIWAQYKFTEYAYARVNKWETNHWTGDLEVNNPDSGGKHGTSNPIGTVSYNVPAFTPGPQGPTGSLSPRTIRAGEEAREAAKKTTRARRSTFRSPRTSPSNR